MLVACYLAVVALFTITTGITYPVLVLFSASVGVGAGAYGLVTAFGLCANSISRPLAGRLSDKLQRGGFIVAGLLLLLLAQVVYAITPSGTAFPVLAIASILVGLGAGMFWPVLNASVVEALPRQQRERPIGLVTATQSVCIAIGAAVGGIVGGRVGYRWTFTVAAIMLGVALAIAVYLYHRFPKAGPERKSMPKGQLTVASLSPATAFFLASAAVGVIVTFLPLYAHVTLQSSTETIGILFSVVLLARAGGSLLISVAAKRGTMGANGRSRLVAAELVFTAALLAATPFIGFAGLAVSQVLIALAMGAGMVSLVALATDAVPPSSLGSAIGTVEAGGFVGSLIGSVGGGVLFQTAPRLLFPAAGAVALAGAISLIPLLRQPNPQPLVPPSQAVAQPTAPVGSDNQE